MVRVYEDEQVVAEELAETPQEALHRAVEMARCYLQNLEISEEALDWVQV